MKSKLLKGVLVIFLGITLSHQSRGQDAIETLLNGGLEDANYLTEGYLEPFMNAFGNGMSNGWYNTAKAHKTLGFDLTITVNAAMVPESEKFYSVDNSRLNNVTLVSPSDGKVPTMFGPDTAPVYRDNLTGDQFDGPSGLGLDEELPIRAVPVPMAQLGIGIIKNTDLKIRWTPEIDLDGEGKIKMWGVGVMHDVKQYIPGIKNLPFDLSGFIGFTKLKLTADLTEASPDLVSTDGEGLFETNSLTIQGLISKKFSILTLYGGVGYNNVKSKIGINGSYTLDPGSILEETLTDPVNLNFGASGPRLTGGFRLKLAILTLHADYTLQKYSTLTAGVGFTVR